MIMDIFKIENFFANSSFFFLLVSMICYWIQVSFGAFNFGRFSMICANFCIFSLLIFRWNESGHFPLSNLYESLMFLSWSLSTFHLFLENVNMPKSSRNSTEELKTSEKKNAQNVRVQSFIGAFTSPTALLINAFATFSLPIEMQHSSALVPALQSNWLMMHVTVMILSYSALICGSLLSIAFLIFTKNIDMDTDVENQNSSVFPNTQVIFQNTENAFQNPQNAFVLPSASLTEFSSDQNSNQISQFETSEVFFKKENFKLSSLPIAKRKFLENLDNLSYRVLGIGFPFLTIGILSGAVWANEAWGSYWSWDPKETWALATWLVFAIYLHTRLTKGWRGKKSAIIASLGFVIVWICFLGVNLLGEGLHSYGFFNK